VGTPIQEMVCKVEYGSDIDTAVKGSGFPMTSNPDLPPDCAEYAKHGWNLNNLPVLPGSVLQYVGGSITGITTPWMYIGMLFSSFCWCVCGSPLPARVVSLSVCSSAPVCVP
jgi:histone demethylase JARID1